MEKFEAGPIENSEKTLNLREILANSFRLSKIRGMEGEKQPDPIAQEILRSSSDLNDVEKFLLDNEITSLSPLGNGFSALVFDTGDKVVRLSQMSPTQKPHIKGILQPLASEIIGGISVQIFKKLETKNITDADVEQVQQEFAEQGYHWDDAAPDNLGRDENGSLFVIDGSVVENKI
jgi:hypothetical protein